MDFVHPTENAIYDIPKVLYLLAPYTGPSFEKFPEQFSDEIVKTSSPSSLEEDYEVNYSQPFSWTWEQLAFAQALLFFGLLMEVLNEALGPGVRNQNRLVPDDFVYTDNGQSFVSSNIGSYFLPWRARAVELKKHNRLEFERSKSKILNIIDQSWLFSMRYLTQKLAIVIHNESISAVQTSIIVLGNMLDSFASELYGRTPWHWPTSLMALKRSTTICPHSKLRLESHFTQDVMYYTTALKWPEDTREHVKCNTTECIALQVRDNKYPTKHLDSCKGCLMVGPNAQQIRLTGEILQHDGIPLIQVIGCGKGSSVQLDIVEAPEKEYIAISHVWSDGLGNPHRNEIPQCQLEQLGQLTASCSGGYAPVPFFLDTICVPLKNSLRKLAIQRLKRTYQMAKDVLVLDSQLQKTSIEIISSGPELALKEAAIRILNSGWMQRLWTFQEGRLAENLKYQFANQVIDHMHIVFRLTLSGLAGFDPIASQAAFHMISITEVTSALDYGPEFQKVSDVVGWRDICLQHVFNAVAWRSTSKAEDEVICLAPLLGVELNQFLETDPEQHIPRLLLKLEMIPISLLFVPGKRHRAANFSWCPKSFLKSCCIYSTFQRSELGQCTAKGLRVNLPGWIINSSTVRLAETLEGFIWRMQDPRSEDSQVYFLFHQFVLSEEQRSHQLAILIKPNEEIAGDKPAVGVCVSCLQKEGKVLTVQFIGHITIAVDGFEQRLRNEVSLKPCAAYTVAETQQWIIV